MKVADLRKLSKDDLIDHILEMERTIQDVTNVINIAQQKKTHREMEKISLDEYSHVQTNPKTERLIDKVDVLNYRTTKQSPQQYYAEKDYHLAPGAELKVDPITYPPIIEGME